MAIDLYTITWNERQMLPFFFRHYEPWVDRFIVYDDQSDDGTAEVLARHPKVELRPYPPKVDSFVLTTLQLWQDVWKESRGKADWVVVTNIDEFFYHPSGMGAYLQRCKAEGITIIHPRGYEMVADRFPGEDASLIESIRKGVPMFGNDKRQLFDPQAIDEINFEPGRHRCAPTGRIVTPPTAEAALLHYKYVDPHQYTIPRQRSLGQRLLEGDRRRGYGMQYTLSPDQILGSFEWLRMHAVDVVSG